MSTLNISGSFNSAYPSYHNAKVTGTAGLPETNPSDTSKIGFDGSQDKDKIKGLGEECETCKNRKYQDGSDEVNVSFKAPAHISPAAAGSAVRAHEGQHVSNAYKKAEMENGEVLRASVSIHTSICPECGRSYISGGTTETQIKYYNEENPYQKDLKTTDGVKYRGMNVNLTA